MSIDKLAVSIEAWLPNLESWPTCLKIFALYSNPILPHDRWHGVTSLHNLLNTLGAYVEHLIVKTTDQFDERQSTMLSTALSSLKY